MYIGPEERPYLALQSAGDNEPEESGIDEAGPCDYCDGEDKANCPGWQRCYKHNGVD